MSTIARHVTVLLGVPVLVLALLLGAPAASASGSPPDQPAGPLPCCLYG